MSDVAKPQHDDKFLLRFLKGKVLIVFPVLTYDVIVCNFLKSKLCYLLLLFNLQYLLRKQFYEKL